MPDGKGEVGGEECLVVGGSGWGRMSGDKGKVCEEECLVVRGKWVAKNVC